MAVATTSLLPRSMPGSCYSFASIRTSGQRPVLVSAHHCLEAEQDVTEKRARYAPTILQAALFSLCCCQRAPTPNNAADAQVDMSLRLNSLEARMSALEGKVDNL